MADSKNKVSRGEEKKMSDLNSDTFRCRFVIDKWEPEVEYKVLKKVAIGKWFFGLINVYKYYWSDWIAEREKNG